MDFAGIEALWRLLLLKVNSREVQNLVRTTIERYMLNRDLDMKDKIYLVNPNYLQSKINALMTIP
jgi:hypothetical protein